MTVPVAAGALALTLLVSLSACSIDPAASGTTATSTLNPNQLEALRRSAAISPTPRTTDPIPTSTASLPPTPMPTPYDADLEAMLPASIRGLPLARLSAPASMYDTGGDICSVFCPGHADKLAQLSGVALADIVVAFAYPDPSNGPRVGILAIRLPGVPTGDLVGIRIREGGLVGSTSDLPADVRHLDVGGHTVTRVLYPPFYQEEQGEYLLATDDVLFVVYGDPPTASGDIPEDVRLAIEALP